MTTEQERTGIPVTRYSLQAQIQDLITQAERNHEFEITMDERQMLVKGYANFIITAIDTYILGGKRHTEHNPLTGEPPSKSTGDFFGINFRQARNEESIDSFHYDLGEAYVRERAASAHHSAKVERPKE